MDKLGVRFVLESLYLYPLVCGAGIKGHKVFIFESVHNDAAEPMNDLL